MSYQVLARKYRPRQLNDVVGQEHVVQTLTNALNAERLHHAYLFSGTRGVGKTTLARIVAKCLNCLQGISATPCDSCANCEDINAGNFVDLQEIDAASRTGVDDTRNLLDNANFGPSRGRFKVFLIDEVHMLSTSSFNALLKTLEEPPDHVKFILATTEVKKLPATVMSRCLQFHLRNIRAEVIEAQLQHVANAETVTCDDEALSIISRAARGSMRDGLSIMDQAIAHGGSRLENENVVTMLGVARTDEVAAILELLAANDRDGLFSYIENVSERAVDFAEMLAALERAVHRLALAATLGGSVPGELESLKGEFSGEWLQSAYQVLIMGGRDMQYAPDPRVGFEMTLIRLIDFEPLTTEDDVQTAPRESKDSQQRDASPNHQDTKQTTSRAQRANSRSQPSHKERVRPKTRAEILIEEAEQDPGVQLITQTFNGRVLEVIPSGSTEAENE